MRRGSIILLLMVVSCGGNIGGTPTSAPAVTATTLPPSSSTAPQTIGCPQDTEFVNEGRIARITQPTSDSSTLGLISIQRADGCERFGFDFATIENAPATTPPSIDAEFLEGEGIVRIHTDLDQTVITDQLVETPLVDRLFVVRDLDGSMFIDLHLSHPARARVSVSNSPAGLTLELSAADGQLSPAAAISDQTVLIGPTNEELIEGPDVRVSGYSRAFEANVLVVATTGGTVVQRTNATAADWTETWGSFETEITLPPGIFDLFVGAESPEDGSLDGVTLKLTVR